MKKRVKPVDVIDKAYKFRIYPNKQQQEVIENSFRVSNFVYNFALSLDKEINEVLQMYGLNDKESLYKYKTEHKLWFNFMEYGKILTRISKLEKYSFLRNVESTLKTYSLKDLAEAFDKIKDGNGFPKFKSGKNKKDSFRTQTQNKSSVVLNKVKGKRYSLKLRANRKNPLSNINAVIHRPEFVEMYNSGKIKINSFTISKNSKGDYFVSFSVEEKIEDVISKKEIKEKSSIGIDLGVKRTVTTSNDVYFGDSELSNEISLYKDSLNELRRLSRILSKKRENNKNYKESNKYKRLLNKMNKLHTSISNRRNSIQHKITSKLINIEDVDTYILEDLNIKNMTKRSAKGLSNKKSGLNRSMLDVGLGEITRQLAYKADWCGKNVEVVDAKYTSQRCNSCGHIEKENRKNQSDFECTKCGHKDNADLNAAKNIKDKFFGK
jgi:putative transposase